MKDKINKALAHLKGMQKTINKLMFKSWLKNDFCDEIDELFQQYEIIFKTTERTYQLEKEKISFDLTIYDITYRMKQDLELTNDLIDEIGECKFNHEKI